MSKKEKRYYLLAATGLLLGALLWGSTWVGTSTSGSASEFSGFILNPVDGLP